MTVGWWLHNRNLGPPWKRQLNHTQGRALCPRHTPLFSFFSTTPPPSILPNPIVRKLTGELVTSLLGKLSCLQIKVLRRMGRLSEVSSIPRSQCVCVWGGVYGHHTVLHPPANLISLGPQLSFLPSHCRNPLIVFIVPSPLPGDFTPPPLTIL